MAMQVFTVGEVLAAADVNEYLVNTRFILKPSDTSRSSTTSQTADPDLTLAVDASKSYILDMFVQYTAVNGSGDLKCSWTAPSGAIFNGMGIGVQASGAAEIYGYQSSGNVLTTAVSYGGGGAAILSFRMSGILVMSTTAGSLTFQWAQNTSNGTATVVKQGSSMLLRRVS